MTEAVPKGTVVRYYDEGWYIGYFEGVVGLHALIRPVGPKGKHMKIKTVLLSDVELT